MGIFSPRDGLRGDSIPFQPEGQYLLGPKKPIAALEIMMRQTLKGQGGEGLGARNCSGFPEEDPDGADTSAGGLGGGKKKRGRQNACPERDQVGFKTRSMRLPVLSPRWHLHRGHCGGQPTGSGQQQRLPPP